MITRNAIIGFFGGLAVILGVGMLMMWNTHRHNLTALDADAFNTEPCSEGCGHCYPSKLKPGEFDENGKMVVYSRGGFHRTLETDYVFAYRNTGNEREPIEHFELFSKESGHETFNSLESMMERIERIPNPKILDFYGNCGAPAWYGIPERNTSAMFDAMKLAKVELRQSRDGVLNFICLCPCENSKK